LTEIINLNRFRKKKTRMEAEKRSEENRAKFGRTKADKESAKVKDDLEKRRLDGHEIKPETPSE